MKKFYTIVKDLRYNSEEAVGKVKNRCAVENELAEYCYEGKNPNPFMWIFI